ncbi:unnamed protein product [Symbiodinium natans]|uniref:Uncharacterized protein n=1 Tax=Symbiodinium natans TaxID=878477 RepID=A0A812UXN5_9DINO|nr:unnamed protein product [Symbiodinium natans]
MNESSESVSGLWDYLPRSFETTSPTYAKPPQVASSCGRIGLDGSCLSEGHERQPTVLDHQDEILDCRLEHAALVARQLRLQAAEQEANREQIQVQQRLTALREEVLQEQKRQDFLQAALQRAQAGGAAMQLASAMTSQRQEAAVAAQNQLLAGKPLLSSLRRECQDRQMRFQQFSRPGRGKEDGDEDIRALRAELHEIRSELAAEQARGARISLHTQALEKEKRSLQAKTTDAMSELQMQFEELVGDSRDGAPLTGDTRLR